MENFDPIETKAKILLELIHHPDKKFSAPEIGNCFSKKIPNKKVLKIMNDLARIGAIKRINLDDGGSLFQLNGGI